MEPERQILDIQMLEAKVPKFPTWKCFDWDFMDFHFPETVTTKFRLMIDDKLH